MLEIRNRTGCLRSFSCKISYFSSHHLCLSVTVHVLFSVLEVVGSVLVQPCRFFRLLFSPATNTHHPKMLTKNHSVEQYLRTNETLTCDTMCKISPLKNPNPASLQLKDKNQYDVQLSINSRAPILSRTKTIFSCILYIGKRLGELKKSPLLPSSPTKFSVQMERG